MILTFTLETLTGFLSHYLFAVCVCVCLHILHVCSSGAIGFLKKPLYYIVVIDLYYDFVCMGVLPAYMSVHVCALCP